MRHLALLALLAFPTLVSSVSAAPTHKKSKTAKKVAPAKWHSTYASALATAKKTGRPIFVDFYTTWCGPCKYLDEVTYKDAKFVAESKKWVLVKIDAEKNKTNVQLAEKFRVDSYPTMVFLKPNGKESERVVGGYPPSLLVPKMKSGVIKALGGKSV